MGRSAFDEKLARNPHYPPHLRLQLHGAIYRPDSFVLMLRYCGNLKAIRYESTSLNKIVADKSHRVIVALGGEVMVLRDNRTLVVSTKLLNYLTPGDGETRTRNPWSTNPVL